MNVKNTKPYIPADDIENIISDIKISLENGELTFGNAVEKFETAFANYVGTKFAVTVNSGTAALEASLRYYDVAGYEVIVPTNTFVASANAVIFAGGTPVLVDIDETNLCASFDDIKNKITSKTKGIILVHACGYIPPYIYELKAFCKENNLFLMEDAAHAHGAAINGQKAGSLGDVGCFSFFPTKPMTTGEGGIVTTDDESLAVHVKELRHHGQRNGLMEHLGYNWRMPTINSIIGSYQLNRLDEFITRRNQIANMYNESLRSCTDIKLIQVNDNIVHSYYKYPIIIQTDKFNASELQCILKEKYGIETGTVYYPPVHLQPYYVKKYGYTEGTLPISENILNRELCLPLFVDMTDDQVQYVISCIKKELS